MKRIEVEEFQKLLMNLNANALQLFEGVGLSHLITTDIKFEETRSGMVCKVKYLQRVRKGVKEVERVFVCFYKHGWDYYGEDENQKLINLFLIKSRIVGDD